MTTTSQSLESARHDGMAAAYDQLRAVEEPHRDWTEEIRVHREIQMADKDAGNLASWTFHQGIITVLSEHCTCQFHRALYGNPRPTLHLQGIGKVPAKPAGELHKGDVLMWNYGYTSTVVSVTPKGRQSVEVVEEYDGGKRYVRIFRRSRLVYAGR